MTKYRFISEKGKNTCEACKKLDGKIYSNIKDISSLPLHPNCRCYVEVISDKSYMMGEIKNDGSNEGIAVNKSKVCNCNVRIKVLINEIEKILLSYEKLEKELDNEIYELKINKGYLNNLKRVLNNHHQGLKTEIGKHLTKCPNSKIFEGAFKNTSSILASIKTIELNAYYLIDKQEEAKGIIKEELKKTEDLNTDIKFMQDYIQKYEHKMDECKNTNEIKRTEEKVKAAYPVLDNCYKKVSLIKKLNKELKDVLDKGEKLYEENKGIKIVPCECKTEKTKSFKEKIYHGGISAAGLEMEVSASAIYNAMNGLKEAYDNEMLPYCLI